MCGFSRSDHAPPVEPGAEAESKTYPTKWVGFVLGVTAQ